MDRNGGETWFPLPNTHSEGGALFNDGRQLRQADVDGQVPRLPAEGAQERFCLETRHPNTTQHNTTLQQRTEMLTGKKSTCRFTSTWMTQQGPATGCTHTHTVRDHQNSRDPQMCRLIDVILVVRNHVGRTDRL